MVFSSWLLLLTVVGLLCIHANAKSPRRDPRRYKEERDERYRERDERYRGDIDDDDDEEWERERYRRHRRHMDDFDDEDEDYEDYFPRSKRDRYMGDRYDRYGMDYRRPRRKKRKGPPYDPTWKKLVVGEGKEKWYHVSKKTMSWSAALEYCQKFVATLPCVESEKENDFLYDKFGQVWLGYNDHDEEGEFKWQEGCPSKFEHFHDEEPNQMGEEDCVGLCGPDFPLGDKFYRRWADLDCDRPWGGGQKAACERNSEPPPEIAREPFRKKMKIYDPGWKKLVVSTIPGQANKTKYYHCSKNTMSWAGALDYCKRMGATLPCVESKQENDFLFDRFGQVWLGLNDHDEEGEMKWQDGCTSTYENFHPEEPNQMGDEDCVGLTGPEWPLGDAWRRQWADLDCDRAWGGGQKAVCERDSLPPPDENEAENKPEL